MKALDKVKLKDDTGVSRAYKIAIGNPTIATVAALQETWIRVVEEWTAALEQPSPTIVAELREKVETVKSPQSFTTEERYGFLRCREEIREKVEAMKFDEDPDSDNIAKRVHNKAIAEVLAILSSATAPNGTEQSKK